MFKVLELIKSDSTKILANADNATSKVRNDYGHAVPADSQI